MASGFSTRGPRPARGLRGVLGLAAAYFIAGRLALLLAIPPGYATAIWPAAGVALAALVTLGPRLWPGIWIGSFLVTLLVGLDAPGAAPVG